MPFLWWLEPYQRLSVNVDPSGRQRCADGAVRSVGPGGLQGRPRIQVMAEPECGLRMLRTVSAAAMIRLGLESCEPLPDHERSGSSRRCAGG